MGLFELGGYILFVLMMAFAVIVIHLKDKRIAQLRDDRNRYLQERNEAVDYANKLSGQVDLDFSRQEEKIQRFQRERDVLLELAKENLPGDQYGVLNRAFEQRVSKMKPVKD
ncbi:hypothetical protein LGV61_00570 [Desulfurispirillum indicum]|uniref:Uncharacterized protein n=1 Tax=Desulfurispirillum indicum (strain ATCC BAA-1389 / DSM 22839 / S5) TaxID=653733 RepID=E6W5D9_DESIS|nr:hypothetical protein [Desulfurispirillum indicum]ADU64870.1 hypothetical protein Selin_0111 [Desulfurispirillum indicum S5]UCZ56801.1 hypothetical protein LGV61_00570 [Desulfurispirillum indicum]